MKASEQILVSAIAAAFSLALNTSALAADMGSSPKSANETAGPVGGATSDTTDRSMIDGSMKDKSKAKRGSMNMQNTPTPKNANETAGPSGGTPPKTTGSMQNSGDTGGSGSTGGTRSGPMQDKDSMTKGAPKNANETAGPSNTAPK